MWTIFCPMLVVAYETWITRFLLPIRVFRRFFRSCILLFLLIIFPFLPALVVSSQKANDKPLSSKINVVSSDKGKNLKKPGGRKKGKNNKKK